MNSILHKASNTAFFWVTDQHKILKFYVLYCKEEEWVWQLETIYRATNLIKIVQLST